MPKFILETRGIVPPVPGEHPRAGTLWSELDSFTQGYIEAMFATNTGCGDSVEWATPKYQHRMREGQTDGDLPNDVGFSDLEPESLASIMADCAAFQAANAALLERAYARDYSATQAGIDYWLTRNGHGAGFWDRKELESEGPEYERLTKIMVEAGHDSAAWGAALTERKKLTAESLGELLSKASGRRELHPFYQDGKVYLEG